MTELSSEFVSDFMHFLRWVHDRYEGAKDGETQRHLWIDLIEILRRMAREIDREVDGEGLVAPLNDLVFALFSLDFGVVDPPLQPRKLQHRPSNPRWALLRGRAAAASELLIRNGAPALATDAWVAKRLSREGYQKPGKSTNPRITAATIKGWRKAAREGRRDELMRAEFETVLEDRDPQIKKFLPEVSAMYESLLKEKSANVWHSCFMRSLTVIETICAHFPPPEKSAEK